MQRIERSEMALATRLIVSAARGRLISAMRTIPAAGASVIASVSGAIADINPPGD